MAAGSVDQLDLAAELSGASQLTDEQLERARTLSRSEDMSEPEAMVKLGYVTRERLCILIAERTECPYVDLSEYDVNLENRDLIPEDLARRHKLFPLFYVEGVLTLAMADPSNLMAIDQVRLHARCEVDVTVADPHQITRLIEKAYSGWEMDEADDEPDTTDVVVGTELSLLLDDASPETAPVVKLVNVILTQAVTDGASDVHVEPDERELRIRLRVDGVLHEIPAPPLKLHPALVARVKVLSNLDVAETRRPQDGHFKLRLAGNAVDFRVSTIPTIYGENLVLRVLNSAAAMIGLPELGVSPRDLQAFERLIHSAHGMVLVTGPTGSGKSTTLYAALARINTPAQNIITVEDPVEYRQAYIRQVQVNPVAGLTFATGLRSILRQDPDVVMVGEIRDRETAQIAVQAALTGHLVFSTLHTNDAPTAVSRLVDMGVDSFLIASSLTGVLAQRLARKVCSECVEDYEPASGLIASLAGDSIPAGTVFRRGRGCKRCRGTGYRSRIGLYELLVMNDALRHLTNTSASSDAIRREARSAGMGTVAEDGVQKAIAGMTTLEEVARVAGQGDEDLPESTDESTPAPPAEAPAAEAPADPPDAAGAGFELGQYEDQVEKWRAPAGSEQAARAEQ